MKKVNARRMLKEAAYEIVSRKAVEQVSVREIVDAAEISKQTFYRYYKDKYELVNEIYYELFQKDIIIPEKFVKEDDWRKIYLQQFSAFREHLDFVRHLFTSRETGCTLDYEIELTIWFDKEILKRKGVDITDPRILFGIEAKDVGGTFVMRDWIIGGMQVEDEEMVKRFELIIPQILVPFYFPEKTR
ncbi:TetR/AcrR family transcriptional regulator [Faecalicatena faecalis]|nr:TetR/AcrR family transcriptional regulator [Faecalicatena faecalis]